MRSTLNVRKTCGGQRHYACQVQGEACPHPWVYDPMINGSRVGAVDIDAYASARGGPRHVRTREQAIHWAAKIQADWLAGRNPQLSPEAQEAASRAETKSVRKLVDAYRRVYAADPELDANPETGRAPAAKLKQPQVVRSELRHIAEYFGDVPAVDLEQERYVQQFAAELADGWSPLDGRSVERGESGVRHLLVRLRAVIRWGIYQHPAWLTKSPFHEHGVKIAALDDTRNRRLYEDWDEEAALLAACGLINDKDHRFAGAALEGRILGALYLAARGSDLDRVRMSQHVIFKPPRGRWPYVLFIGRARGGGKAKADRQIHFDPQGRLGAYLDTRRFLKPPNDHAFGNPDGHLENHYKAWVTVRLLAWNLITPDGRGRTMETDQRLLRETVNLQFRDLRRECASRWYYGYKDRPPIKGGLRTVQQLLGHSTLSQTERYLQLPPGGDHADALAEAMGWGGRTPSDASGKLATTTAELRRKAHAD